MCYQSSHIKISNIVVLLFLTFSISQIFSGSASAQIEPARLTCEYRTDPLGIDVEAPLLAWQATAKRRGQRQSGYRVIVASKPELLEAEKADLWNSGWINSAESIGIRYEGRPLVSGQKVFWTVQLCDENGKPSSTLPIGSWQMGLLEKSDWGGKWIGFNRPLPGKDEDFYKDRPAPAASKELLS